jgi:hypothetical protein
MSRPWDLVEERKQLARAQRFRDGGPARQLVALGELRARFRRAHPEGLPAETRDQDLAAHIALAAKLRKVADAIARR